MEYASVPPGATRADAAESIRSCSVGSVAELPHTDSCPSDHATSGWRRIVPVPEHGASTNTWPNVPRSSRGTSRVSSRVASSVTHVARPPSPPVRTRSRARRDLNATESTQARRTLPPSRRFAPAMSRVFVARPCPTSSMVPTPAAGAASHDTICAAGSAGSTHVSSTSPDAASPACAPRAMQPGHGSLDGCSPASARRANA